MPITSNQENLKSMKTKLHKAQPCGLYWGMPGHRQAVTAL